MEESYFNFFEDNEEWNLYNNFSNELNSMLGIPVKYIKRELINPDYMLGEDTISEFVNSIDMKLYPEDYQDFSGQGNIFEKFGLTLKHQMNFVAPIDYINDLLGHAPIEGDLVVLKFSNAIFEISFVNNYRAAFFHLGKTMLYRFTCTLFTYSHEDFNTGDSEIDQINMLSTEDLFEPEETEQLDFNVNQYVDKSDESDISKF